MEQRCAQTLDKWRGYATEP